VDLGGTKIEFVALERDGRELHRHRIATPRFDYEGTVCAVAHAAEGIEKELGRSASVGMGNPRNHFHETGLVKNANSTWLNGKPFDKDLSRALGREVRCANDANCLAVSEATDGAGAGKHVVFAVILGTGCGGGIAVDGRVHGGLNGVAGEWGTTHCRGCGRRNIPVPRVIAGGNGCIETWISGTGLEADYKRATGVSLKGPRNHRAKRCRRTCRARRARSIRRPAHARSGASHQSS